MKIGTTIAIWVNRFAIALVYVALFLYLGYACSLSIGVTFAIMMVVYPLLIYIACSIHEILGKHNEKLKNARKERD